MAMETIHLEHVPPDLPVHVALFRDVKNAGFLKEQLLAGNGDFEYAFIDAAIIMSRVHLLAATFRAVNEHLTHKLRTRNVHSEVVYSLSPTSNIADSFRRFGISDETTNLLAIKVAVNPSFDHETVQTHLQSVVEGKLSEFADEELSYVTDLAKVRKAYKIGLSNAKSGKGTKTNEVNGQDPNDVHEMEVTILGMIALKGAT